MSNLNKILAKLSDDERAEVQKTIDGMKADAIKEAKSEAEANQAFEKILNEMSEKLAAIEDKQEKAVKSKQSKELKNKLNRFDEDTNEAELKSLIEDARVEKYERVKRYETAKKEKDHTYVRRVNRRVAAYFKALVNGDSQVVRALVEGTDTQGGYLVPEEFRMDVVQELQNNAVMRQIATTIPLNTDKMNIPTEAARPAVYWTSEDATLSTSSAEFGEIELTPHKLIGRLPVTHELLQDSAIALISYLTRVFGEELAQAEDAAFFTGSGTGRPKGVDAYTLSTVAAPANKADGIYNLFYRLKRAYRSRSSWVMNTNTLRNVRKLKDSQNQYLWQPSLQAGEPERLLGRPVYEQNDLPVGKIFLGDFSYYMIGDREQMSAMTTTEGGTAWDRDRVELKVRERVDGKLALTRAFVEGTGF